MQVYVRKALFWMKTDRYTAVSSEVRFSLKPYKVHIFSMEDEKRLYFEEGVLK